MAYVRYIAVCVKYSSYQIRLQQIEARLGSCKMKDIFAMSLLDAYALNQAVSETSAWSIVLPQNGSCVFKEFCEYLTNHGPKANFHGSVNELSVFSGDENIVTQVSVMTWFKKHYIAPKLRQIMDLTMMKTLALAMNNITRNKQLRHHDKEESYEKHAMAAAETLGIKLSMEDLGRVTSQLAAFAILAQSMIDNIDSNDKSNLIRGCIGPNFGLQLIAPHLITQKEPLDHLRDLVVHEPPIMSDQVANEYIQQSTGLGDVEARLKKGEAEENRNGGARSKSSNKPGKGACKKAGADLPSQVKKAGTGAQTTGAGDEDRGAEVEVDYSVTPSLDGTVETFEASDSQLLTNSIDDANKTKKW
jgi:hypothetical protein